MLSQRGAISAVTIRTTFKPPDGVPNMFFYHAHENCFGMWSVTFALLALWLWRKGRVGGSGSAASTLPT